MKLKQEILQSPHYQNGIGTYAPICLNVKPKPSPGRMAAPNSLRPGLSFRRLSVFWTELGVLQQCQPNVSANHRHVRFLENQCADLLPVAPRVSLITHDGVVPRLLNCEEGATVFSSDRAG